MKDGTNEIIKTSNPNISCTQLPAHWRCNKALTMPFKVIGEGDIPDKTEVTIMAVNEDMTLAPIRNNTAYTQDNVATFSDLRFIGRSGRGKSYGVMILIKCQPLQSVLIKDCIKITVDGPREPRKRRQSDKNKTKERRKDGISPRGSDEEWSYSNTASSVPSTPNSMFKPRASVSNLDDLRRQMLRYPSSHNSNDLRDFECEQVRRPSTFSFSTDNSLMDSNYGHPPESHQVGYSNPSSPMQPPISSASIDDKSDAMAFAHQQQQQQQPPRAIHPDFHFLGLLTSEGMEGDSCRALLTLPNAILQQNLRRFQLGIQFGTTAVGVQMNFTPEMEINCDFVIPNTTEACAEVSLWMNVDDECYWAQEKYYYNVLGNEQIDANRLCSALSNMYTQYFSESQKCDESLYQKLQATEQKLFHRCVNALTEIGRYRVLPVVENNSGMTLLHLAACLGWLQFLKLLLDSGADINQVDSHGCTAADWAFIKGQTHAVNYLLSLNGHIQQRHHQQHHQQHQQQQNMNYQQQQPVMRHMSGSPLSMQFQAEASFLPHHQHHHQQQQQHHHHQQQQQQPQQFQGSMGGPMESPVQWGGNVQTNQGSREQVTFFS